MSILLEGTISNQPNSFSFSLQGKKKSWASHGLLEKVEEISISLRLLTGSHVYAIEYRIASATTSWAALNASCRWFMSFMSPKPSGAESYSGKGMFKLDGLNRKKTQKACLKEPTAPRVRLYPT